MKESSSSNVTLQRSNRIRGMAISKILLLAQTAREMMDQGISVIDLSAGQPDFHTPENICRAAKEAMDAGETGYTALDGTVRMKDAIRTKFSVENGVEFDRSEVMAGAGAKQLIYNAFMSTLNEGDEVILPTPCWLSYFDMVKIAGGVPVAVCGTLETGYKITPEQLREAITPKCKWILLNSPNNPSGAVYSSAELATLLNIIEEHQSLWVMSDDVYEHIRYSDTAFATAVAVRPDLRDRILTVNAVSKAYAMTGWRLGYTGGPSSLIQAMCIVQSQSTSNPSSISQAAAIEALTGPADFLEQSQKIYARRRRILFDGLSAIDGIEVPLPEGSFFIFVRISKIIGLQTNQGFCLNNDTDVSDYLLESAHVVTVPGSEFGLPEHLRLSFAASDEKLFTAIDRITIAIAALNIK